MELVEFPSLDKVKLTSEKELKFVMLQLCEAISYLHHHKIIHRDIKPENILINPLTKKIKLVDFGIAKCFLKRETPYDLWTSIGTVSYKAPEMLRGKSYREGVDVWAAGITLFQLICGRTPFES